MRRSRPGYSPAVQHAREPQFQARWQDVVVIDAATSLTESLATGGRVITGTNSRNSCTIGRLLLHSSGTTYSYSIALGSWIRWRLLRQQSMLDEFRYRMTSVVP